jgi:hypothetical protein
MINHARTLLLNTAPLLSAPVLPDGEEFIPHDFTPLRLPQKLAAIHEVFIPVSSTREQRNYLAFIFMQMAHSPNTAAGIDNQPEQRRCRIVRSQPSGFIG